MPRVPPTRDARSLPVSGIFDFGQPRQFPMGCRFHKPNPLENVWPGRWRLGSSVAIFLFPKRNSRSVKRPGRPPSVTSKPSRQAIRRDAMGVSSGQSQLPVPTASLKCQPQVPASSASLKCQSQLPGLMKNGFLDPKFGPERGRRVPALSFLCESRTLKP